MDSPTETTIPIACMHCSETGCITCHGLGAVEALTPSHQFMAGWRHVTIDPVDSDGEVQVFVTNRHGHPSKGLRFDEAELRELVRVGCEHFARVDREAAR